jgi:glycosyltransferase involved in cell wall biosynthesis
MARALRDRLVPGGLLVVCRTEARPDGDVNLATVLRKAEGSLEIVARLNGGSDVEDLLAQEHGRDRLDLTSVVLPVLNGEPHLAEQLTALGRQTYDGPWELVVVDNGCTDRSLEIVDHFRRALPPIVLVDARRHQGLGRARNAGAAAARGELLAYCDADDVVAPDWLEALVRGAGHADVVGGACRHDLNDEVQCAWEGNGGSAALGEPYKFLSYPAGGNCAVWADVAREVHWDESFAFGASDIEFGWRAQLAGFQFAFEPRAVIQQRFRGSPAAVGRRAFRGGIAEPLLYRRFRDHGMPRSNVLRALLAWCGLAATAGRLARGAEGRGKWLRTVGTRAGRVCGSVRHRTLYL